VFVENRDGRRVTKGYKTTYIIYIERDSSRQDWICCTYILCNLSVYFVLGLFV
jgi:hypothetical protein